MTHQSCGRCGKLNPADIHTCTPKQEEGWEGMSEEVRIAFLAEEVMQWHESAIPSYTGVRREWMDSEGGWRARKENGSTIWFECLPHWNPLRSWESWRQVEEKIIEDEKLWIPFTKAIFKSSTLKTTAVLEYMKANLPKRCKALFLAYSSLHPND